MSHIRPMHTERYSDCKLERISGKEYDSEIVAFKLMPPKRFGWAMIIFSPIGVFIGGDLRLGSAAGGQASSAQGWDLFGMLGKCDEEYLGEKFFGRCPSGPKAKAQWSSDVGWLSALQKEFVRTYTNLVALEESVTKERDGAIKGLEKYAEGLRLTTDDLDDEVHQGRAEEASEVNNGGLYYQLGYLFDTHTGPTKDRIAEIEKTLDLVAKEKEK